MATSFAQRYSVYYTGHVQGVGFRYTANSVARDHKVTGYVRNLPDGRVELVAEGERSEVEAFLEQVRERLSNHIRSETRDLGPATYECSSFNIRH